MLIIYTVLINPATLKKAVNPGAIGTDGQVGISAFKSELAAAAPCFPAVLAKPYGKPLTGIAAPSDIAAGTSPGKALRILPGAV